MSSGRSFLLFLWNFGDIIPYVRFSIQVIGLVLTSCIRSPICTVWPPSFFDPPSLACHWPQLSLSCPPTHNSAVLHICSMFTLSSILCLQPHRTCILWLAALITLWTYLHLLLVPHALCFHLYLWMEKNPCKGHCQFILLLVHFDSLRAHTTVYIQFFFLLSLLFFLFAAYLLSIL